MSAINISCFFLIYGYKSDVYLRFLNTEGHHGFKVCYGCFICVLCRTTFLLQKHFQNILKYIFFPNVFLHFELECDFPDLSAADLLANEEVYLLCISWRVVYSTGRRQSISPSSTRLLVVTGQGLSQVPVSYESVKINKNISISVCSRNKNMAHCLT